jgi:hypothetical protein
MYNVTEIINNTKGKFFRITYKRKDGTIKTMTARLGVSKDIKGTGLRYRPEDHGLLCVWSVDDNGYRMINLDAVSSLTCNSKEYIFLENCLY